MIILVCGGRDYTDHVTFNREMFKVVCELTPITVGPHIWDRIAIIHGNARGADTCADTFAKMFGCHNEPYPAKWDTFGPGAGPIRNQQMLDTGIDLVVAFPGGNGTADMVRRAKKAGVRVIEVGA